MTSSLVAPSQAASAGGGVSSYENLDLEAISELLKEGYPREKCAQALLFANNDRAVAKSILEFARAEK